jgi:WD40 repeat protein
LHESPEYIENAQWLRHESVLVLWNAHETYVYALPHLQGQGLKRLFIYNKISRRENLSLDYAVSLPLKVMAAGYQSGTIKLYHFDDSRKYLQELRGHQGACMSVLVPPESSSFLYSASADSSIRIWNLVDF